MSVCVSVCLSVCLCLSICVCIFLSIWFFLSFSLFLALYFSLFFSLSFSLSFSMNVFVVKGTHSNLVQYSHRSSLKTLYQWPAVLGMHRHRPTATQTYSNQPLTACGVLDFYYNCSTSEFVLCLVDQGKPSWDTYYQRRKGKKNRERNLVWFQK